MNVLLDTHTFIWWIADADRLSSRVRTIIEDPDNELYLSVASGWEMVIKARLGKLDLIDDLPSFIFEQVRANHITVLPIHMSHAMQVYSLPGHHRDPFDRMLVAQSQVEQMPILTSDPKIARYPVVVIW